MQIEDGNYEFMPNNEAIVIQNIEDD